MREGKLESLHRCYAPSRTRRVDSTSLMSTLPSLASFTASTARWAPPSLEKRMKPFKERPQIQVKMLSLCQVVENITGAYTGFCTMKRLGVFLLFPK